MRRGRVLVIGLGGLGCPVLWALGPSVATVGIVDDDQVDLSNLHRQILYRTEDVGRPKVDAAATALGRFAGLAVEPHRLRVSAANVAALIDGYDVVVDGTDAVATKFLLNDACVRQAIPLVHGGVLGWQGQLMAIVPGQACLRCLFEGPDPDDEPPTCGQVGVIGPVAGVIGGRMAEETLHILDGKAAPNGLVLFDGRTEAWRSLSVRRRVDCSCTALRGAGERSGRPLDDGAPRRTFSPAQR